MLLQGLMKIGLFRPDLDANAQPSAAGSLKGIRFSDRHGKTVDLGDLEGKIIFINFWATWCPPCRAEMPSLNKLYTEWKKDEDVVFLFVDADSKLQLAEKFLQNKGYSWPVYTAASDVPREIFGGSLPTTVVFDKQGRLSFRHEGMADYGNKRFDEFFIKLKSTGLKR